MTAKAIFERTEKKYVITNKQKQQLLDMIKDKICDDEYGESTVCSLYFDTDDYRLIRTSIDKPIYKEKLRLRSYGTPHGNSTVFLELKKKFNGIVYKRRETMTLHQADLYILKGEMPKDTQIMREINWVKTHYKNLLPRMSVCYDRNAYYSKEDTELRITFDKNVRFRNFDLDLSHGSYGEKIIDDNTCVMEIKALYAMPLWLCNALNTLKIYPSSFSKYGTAYRICLQRDFKSNGGENCA